MALFKDMLKKWFYTQGTSPTISSTTRLPVLDSSGDPVGSTELSSLSVEIIKTAFDNKSTAIPSGGDLNTYTDPGVYCVSISGVSATILNKPENAVVSYFILWVINPYGASSSQYLRQIYLAHTGIWTRGKMGGNMGDWVRLA